MNDKYDTHECLFLMLVESRVFQAITCSTHNVIFLRKHVFRDDVNFFLLFFSLIKILRFSFFYHLCLHRIRSFLSLFFDSCLLFYFFIAFADEILREKLRPRRCLHLGELIGRVIPQAVYRHVVFRDICWNFKLIGRHYFVKIFHTR